MSYVDSDADSGMCICCPNVDDKIAMKTLKDPEREKSIQNMVQNGIIQNLAKLNLCMDYNT
jgi:hypothetical protein